MYHTCFRLLLPLVTALAAISPAAPAGAAPAPVDFSIAMTAAPDPVFAGDDLTYTISVRHSATGNAWGYVTDRVPGPLRWAASSHGSCEERTASVVYCSVDKLRGGDVATITIVVVAPSTDVTNTAKVYDEADQTNNVATVTTDVISTPSGCTGDFGETSCDLVARGGHLEVSGSFSSSCYAAVCEEAEITVELVDHDGVVLLACNGRNDVTSYRAECSSSAETATAPGTPLTCRLRWSYSGPVVLGTRGWQFSCSATDTPI